jgi:hypothetical protein
MLVVDPHLFSDLKDYYEIFIVFYIFFILLNLLNVLFNRKIYFYGKFIGVYIKYELMFMSDILKWSESTI